VRSRLGASSPSEHGQTTDGPVHDDVVVGRPVFAIAPVLPASARLGLRRCLVGCRRHCEHAGLRKRTVL